MRFHLLPDMSALTGAEYLPGSQAASDKKFSLNTLRTWLLSTAASLAANSTAVTPAAGDSSTKIPTTEFVARAVSDQFAVTTDATNARAMGPSDSGKYIRFTAAGAKTATFDSATAGWAANQTMQITNRAATDDLTLVAATAMVLNAPNGGSLVLAPGDTVLVKLVSPTEADVMRG